MDINEISKIMVKEKLAFVIFGVTGDLTKRKLIPALFELYRTNRVQNEIIIIGFARRDWNDQFLRDTLYQAVMEFAKSTDIDEERINELLKNTRYIQSSFDDQDGYQKLSAILKETEIHNVLYYLATPPEAYKTIIQSLGNAKLNKCDCDWIRIVIEKPYGRDLITAQDLDRAVHDVFEEKQVYRIDHYLGKETVQNILVFRFANGIFEPLWNRNYIDHVEITVAESVGVGTRAGYYETAGVIRDMFQNHLLQLLSLTAMEAPVTFNDDCVRDEKVKVLRALRPMSNENAIQDTFRAQYVSGIIDGKRVDGYKYEVGVASESTVETYLAAKLFVDNWRWAGVPFYLRSGKRMPVRETEIAIQFKQIPLSLFNWQNLAGDAPNVLVMHIQPDEGVSLTLGAKAPGPINQIAPVKMEFDYKDAFGTETSDAYVRLILDSILGDATLFTRSDEVNAQWAFTSKIIESWEQIPAKNLPVYEAGTWGPPGADMFIQKDGRKWLKS